MTLDDYPFGLKHKGYNNVVNGTHHPYKMFQGQEHTEDLELNVYEWRYRTHDPAIGRFWQVDPLAEKYYWMTTYQFSSNQPIHAPELEGLESSDDLNLNSEGRVLLNTANEMNDNPNLLSQDKPIFTFGLGVDKSETASAGLPGAAGTDGKATAGEMNIELQLTSGGETILETNASLGKVKGNGDILGNNSNAEFSVLDADASYNLNTNEFESNVNVLEGKTEQNGDTTFSISAGAAYIKTNLDELGRSLNDVGIFVKTYVKHKFLETTNGFNVSPTLNREEGY